MLSPVFGVPGLLALPVAQPTTFELAINSRLQVALRFTRIGRCGWIAVLRGQPQSERDPINF